MKKNMSKKKKKIRKNLNKKNLKKKKIRKNLRKKNLKKKKRKKNKYFNIY